MSSVPKHLFDLTTSLAALHSPLLFYLLPWGKEPSVVMQVRLLRSRQLALKCLC